ncbi:pyruvate carboxylase [Parasphingopyxis lamellibrachiae]|uniref:Pyruvate carboxylase n=1 Tax=Parasphingopyxis lamellibrachiae TaxID=680125 RepID=A0A3D9F874_9SPHN|nr:pyruvate carboxylase [Parasphingopyxis lamellibrachiae]RED13360.1 pyruvate carboxylase [Parasphingopyxis lamellibrachiae]
MSVFLHRHQHTQITKLLVANRSEIAIRVFRAASELGIGTVGIYAEQDKLSLHRFKCDEAYHLGDGKGAIDAYLDSDRIIAIAREAGADAIHPGYGFLSEDPAFAESSKRAGLIFIGPSPKTMHMLGNKVSARKIAIAAGVPVIPATDPLPADPNIIKAAADELGYPVMLKASWGGGGRGMRSINSSGALIAAVDSGRREAHAVFGRDEVYLEKLIQRARHIEVQLLGDHHGNIVHLYERDCSIQRRNQKIIERAPAPYLDEITRNKICEAALAIGRTTNYVGAGTVEFLLDEDSGNFYFIEVNPRIQVEHTVTEVVTGIDIVKAQIKIANGNRVGVAEETGVPCQTDIQLNGHALQCRVTTEDPQNNFIPDYGRIAAYRGAFGFGIRIDGGTAYSGAIVTRHYDPLLEKIVAWAPTGDEAIARMVRALREYRIRGVATNLQFLVNVLTHPDFLAGQYTTRFIDEEPELLRSRKRQDRASRLLRYIADVTVNGHPDVKGRARPATHRKSTVAPQFDVPIQDGTRQRFQKLGAVGFARWMREHPRILITDTTMRDAHQSLLATRMRTTDMVRIANDYARGLPGLLSVECWGGATFDVAMRFLQEDPWDRLFGIRETAPNLLTQMLLRGANGVGYTNYPDNVVRHFIAEAAQGIDIFRIFDCLNWVENMRVAIDAVVESGKIAEGALCYTGDILNPDRAKYNLAYYAGLARELEAAGCHILAIKDMAGLLKPGAATALINALRNETDLPIHLHTHDTSGAAAATILAAIDAGVDAVDAAMDSMSGTTSQPCLGSIVEAVHHTDRDSGLSSQAIRQLSFYWENVRSYYTAFEQDLKSGASEVYMHEMPGGQFTNLKEQARSLDLEDRWHEVSAAYTEANMMFGDIVKVTPSSKVVGDMALMMVSQNLSANDILDENRDIAFPSSVEQMLHGDLGQPPGGWPTEIQSRVLKEIEPITVRPASLMQAADLEAKRREAEERCGRKLQEREFASYLMYPEVFTAFAKAQDEYGIVSVIDTPVYFYGMEPGDEIAVDIERGKTLIIRLLMVSLAEDDGTARVYFELNGQPRVISVKDRSAVSGRPTRPIAQAGNTNHIGAPMPGVVSTLAVKRGDTVKVGTLLMTLEAMKMETALTALRDGEVADIFVEIGSAVDAKDLLLTLEDEKSEQV